MQATQQATLCICLVTLGIVFGGATIVGQLGAKDNGDSAYLRFDAIHYQEIAARGYSYNPQSPSVVAFFPAFPLIGSGIAVLLGLSSDKALLLAANLSLLVAMTLWGMYLNAPKCNATQCGADVAAPLMTATFALLAFALFPTTFFFRMPYSESLFLLLAIGSMLAMKREFPLWFIAILAGATTAARPVGVAVLLPFAIHVVSRSTSSAQVVLKLLGLLPVACWGLIAFMAYQWYAFDDPLAFAHTQSHWRVREYVSLGDKALSLASLEPVWSTYLPNAPGRWNQWDAGSWMFSLAFFNPLYFCGTALLIAVGAWNRWLDAKEIALSVALLAIPYLTRSYEWGMLSHGRFAAVVFPAYIVMGQLLARLPLAVSGALLALSGFMLGAYSALFAAGKPLF